MEQILMQPQFDDYEEDGVFNLENEPASFKTIIPEQKTAAQLKQEEIDDGVIDLNEYTESGEEEKASWWDVAKDVIIQPALGLGSAFAWPLDVLKLGMVAESLTDVNELQEAYEKAGKTFDKNKYLKTVSEQYEFIPTWDLLEKTVEERAGINLHPKSNTGKNIRRWFNLFGLVKGKGLTKAVAKQAAKGATAGVVTTSLLKKAGLNETASDIIGDIAAGGTAALKKEPRVFSPEVAELEQIATKHGLPFPEYLTKEPSQLVNPKISEKRMLALQKNIGLNSKEAIDEVISGRLPIQRLKQQGADLEVLKDAAYDKVTALAKNKTNPIPMNQVIADIDLEISRIKKVAPSPSDADKAAIAILEKEKDILSKVTPTTEELVEQIKKYNSNVTSIYQRPEFSGREDAVKGAYAFLNNSIRNTVEAESGKTIRQAMRAADALNGEVAKLERVEGLVSKAFLNGEYNPKKLQSLLNSKQGLIVRRELGDQAINDIRDIAKYGDKAVKATTQLAKSAVNYTGIREWGPLAGFLLYRMPKTAGVLLAGKAVGNRIRGYLLTNPATRTQYAKIMKNAANGSFKAMSQDFAKLEEEISKNFGSIDEFMKAMSEDLEYINE
jgi:hypothetical protein